MATLPNMNIILPTLGQDSGQWDDKLNAALTLVDAHDHTSGKGPRVPTAGININADLAFGGYGPTGLGKAAFNAVTALTTGSKTLFVSSADNELYWRNNGGTNVKLTSGSTINIALVGGIVGDYSSVGAEVAYSDADKVYTFKQNGSPKPWARIASGPVRIHEYNTTETVYVELAIDAALASSYTLTLPAALPGANGAVLQISSAGIVSYAASVALAANQSFQVSGTGKHKHGTKYVTVALNTFFALPQSGTVANNGGEPGITPDDGIDLYYPLPDCLTEDNRVVSITLYIDSTPGLAIGYTFALSGLVVSTLADGSDTLSSTSATPTLTLATPISLAPADNGGYYVKPWIKIEIPSTVNVVFTHMRVGFDNA